MMQLKSKVTLILLPVIICPMIFIGLLFYHHQAENLIEDVGGEIASALEHTNERFQNRIDVAKGNIGLIAQSYLIHQYLNMQDDDQRFYLLHRPILDLFKSYQRVFPEYISVQLLDAEGIEQVRLDDIDHLTRIRMTPELLAGYLSPDSALLSKSHDLTVILPPRPSHPNPNLLVIKAISAKTYTEWHTDAEFEAAGYVVLIARLDDLLEVTNNIRIGNSGKVYMTSDSGVPYHDHTNETAFDDHLLTRMTLAADKDTRQISFDGRNYLIGHKNLVKDLQAVAVWPLTELQTTAIELAREIAWLTLLFTSTIVALILVVVHTQLIKPISALTLFTRSLNKSRMEIEESVHQKYRQMLGRYDEFGELAKAFRELDSNLRASNLRLSFIAYHDSLTGLANRHTFSIFLHKTIAAAQRHDFNVALLYIDIDGFKEVNDTLGHEAGDSVLKDIADRLNGVLRGEDLVADFSTYSQHVTSTKVSRIGGDEFAIVISHLDHPEHAAVIALRLLQVMEPAFELNADRFQLGASIGISLYPQNGSDAQELLKCADIAMYQSKRQGRNRYEYYNRSIDEEALRRNRLIKDLRQAIDEKRLEIHYQPQIQIRGHKTIGFEALLRWYHLDEGFIPPDTFIPLAEETGLIQQLGEYVVYEVCRQYHEWSQQGLAPPRIAVNVSPFQFTEKCDIATYISQTLQDFDLPGNMLEVEVTETAIMQSKRIHLSQLEALKALGLNISMDDFGTGYSSLASLRDLPIDRLKIDKSFVNRIEDDAQGQGIIKAIIALARELNINVVAEGVETETQLEFLRQHYCEVAQGYFFSRPINADKTTHYLGEIQSSAKLPE